MVPARVSEPQVLGLHESCDWHPYHYHSCHPQDYQHPSRTAEERTLDDDLRGQTHLRTARGAMAALVLRNHHPQTCC